MVSSQFADAAKLQDFDTPAKRLWNQEKLLYKATDCKIGWYAEFSL